MLMNVLITFPIKVLGPYIAQVTFVAPAEGSRLNSAVLWPSKGLMKIELDQDPPLGRYVHDFHPALACFFAFPLVNCPLTVCRTSVSSLEAGV